MNVIKIITYQKHHQNTNNHHYLRIKHLFTTLKVHRHNNVLRFINNIQDSKIFFEHLAGQLLLSRNLLIHLLIKTL